MMSTLAVGAIELYRRHLSPLKGFRCAHNVLHQNGSCSDFGLRVYGRLPTLAATTLLARRIKECRVAYVALVATVLPTDSDDGAKGKHSRRSGPCDMLDAMNCVTTPVPAGCGDIGACDCLGGLF